MYGQGSDTGGGAAPTVGGGGEPPADGPDEDDRHELADLLGGLVRRSGRHLAAEVSPLEVECWASRYWALCRDQELTGADPEELFGVGSIEQAAALRSPEGLAVLRALAAVAPSRYAGRAGAEADRLASAGVGEPAWSALLGRARATEAWLLHDPLDDDDASVLVAFEAPGSQTASILIDHNLGGIARDAAVVAAAVGEVVRAMQRDGRSTVRGCTRIGLGEAAARWRAALGRLDEVPDPPVSAALRELRVLLEARLRALPPDESVPPRDVPGQPAREQLVLDFLRTDEAAALAAAAGASAETVGPLAREILDFGLDAVTGTPLRFSPSMVEAFVRDWRSPSSDTATASRALLPGVLAAWIRFAGRRRALPDAAVAAALRAIPATSGVGGDETHPPTLPAPEGPRGSRDRVAPAEDEAAVHDLFRSLEAPGDAGHLVGQVQ